MVFLWLVHHARMFSYHVWFSIVIRFTFVMHIIRRYCITRNLLIQYDSLSSFIIELNFWLIRLLQCNFNLPWKRTSYIKQHFIQNGICTFLYLFSIHACPLFYLFSRKWLTSCVRYGHKMLTCMCALNNNPYIFTWYQFPCRVPGRGHWPFCQ